MTEDAIAKLATDMKALHLWKNALDVERAVEKERMGQIDKTLKSILETVRWLLLTVFGTAVAIIVNFAMSGGFNP